MKKYIILNRLIVSSLIFFLFSTIGIGQTNRTFIGIRVPLQLDFEKESILKAPVFLPKEQKATVLNFGIDVLLEKEFGKKINAYIGIGYFRNKFKFQRFYDHQLLNTGTDSLSIGTGTINYIYNLARFPIGFSYKISEGQKNTYKLGAEFILNYSFQRIYNGGKPFPDANNKSSDFQYLGNSINLFASISIPINNYSILELQPYIRVYNTYRKDKIFYDNPSDNTKHSFDAFGFSIKYPLTFKKK